MVLLIFVQNLSSPFSSLILVKFTHALVKSRPLKETGAEQVRPSLIKSGYVNTDQL